MGDGIIRVRPMYELLDLCRIVVTLLSSCLASGRSLNLWSLSPRVKQSRYYLPQKIKKLVAQCLTLWEVKKVLIALPSWGLLSSGMG